MFPHLADREAPMWVFPRALHAPLCPALANCFQWHIGVRASPIWKLPWDKDPLMDSWLTSWLSGAIQGRLKGHVRRGTLATINPPLFSFFLSPSHRLIHQRTFAKPPFRDPGFKTKLYFTKRRIRKSLARSLQGQKGKKSSNCHFYTAFGGKKEKRKG